VLSSVVLLVSTLYSYIEQGVLNMNCDLQWVCMSCRVGYHNLFDKLKFAPMQHEVNLRIFSE
jgi:hypothetical protein